MEKQLIYLLILRTFRVEMSSPGVISFAYTDFEINSVKNKWTAYIILLCILSAIDIKSVAVKIHKSF